MASEDQPPRGTQMAKGALCALLLSLLMVPILWPACQRFFSMAASTYVPGTLSAAFVTCPNQTVAKEIARAVVEKRLAACVNIVPQVTSIYEWKGKIEEDSEVMLMIKTRTSRISSLAEFIRSVHPYEVAEVIALPIQEGNPPYLQWVKETVPAEKAAK